MQPMTLDNNLEYLRHFGCSQCHVYSYLANVVYHDHTGTNMPPIDRWDGVTHIIFWFKMDYDCFGSNQYWPLMTGDGGLLKAKLLQSWMC